MAVLVTGGAGYIGSHMVWRLLDAAETVIVADRLSTGFEWAVAPEARLLVGDIGDPAFLDRVFKAADIEAIIHFAGSIVVPESLEDPLGYYLNNTVNSRLLIEKAVRNSVRNFIFSSTAAVYGKVPAEPVDESQPAVPETPYGRSKLMTEQMLADTARAAAKFGVKTVTGFTGSSVWHATYAFPPTTQAFWDKGFADFGRRFTPILDVFEQHDINFALEVHPTEIAFDIASSQRAIDAVNGHRRFGFNFDPSHLAYQGVDYVKFIRLFHDRIYNAHMKDVWWGKGDGTVGVFGGHTSFGDARRFWDFRSVGRGMVDFESIIVALNDIGYAGPLSVEWEDSRMDRVHGATESAAFCKRLDFKPAAGAFDAVFAKENQ